ncbi:MAG: hypothetical protein ACTSPV_05180 [Candidatus Hodarchaeales archaeon]
MKEVSLNPASKDFQDKFEEYLLAEVNDTDDLLETFDRLVGTIGYELVVARTGEYYFGLKLDKK